MWRCTGIRCVDWYFRSLVKGVFSWWSRWLFLDYFSDFVSLFLFHVACPNFGLIKISCWRNIDDVLVCGFSFSIYEGLDKSEIMGLVLPFMIVVKHIRSLLQTCRSFIFVNFTTVNSSFTLLFVGNTSARFIT